MKYFDTPVLTPTHRGGAYGYMTTRKESINLCKVSLNRLWDIDDSPSKLSLRVYDTKRAGDAVRIVYRTGADGVEYFWPYMGMNCATSLPEATLRNLKRMAEKEFGHVPMEVWVELYSYEQEGE